MNKSTEDISPSKDGVSPLGISRYGRTRKPKVSQDFCDIDDAIERTYELRSPIKTNNKTFKSPVNQSEYAKAKNALQNASEKTTVYDLKIKSITHTNTAKTIGPKPRKFFKTAANVQPHITGDYVPPNFLEDDLGLTESIFDSSPIDVSQVLKIITAKNIPEVPVETKKSPKQLKTYVNKRKKIAQQPVVIESFGLPDEPIIPLLDSDAPFEAIKELDVGTVEPEKVNLIDTSLIDTFWQVEPTVEVPENSVDDPLGSVDISDKTAAKDKENLGNKRMTRSKSQYCNLNKTVTSDDDKIETPKKLKKRSKSPSKKNFKEMKDSSPKTKHLRQEISHSNGIESCDDNFININKLKDQLSIKIENGRPVGDVQIVKVKKSPRTPKQGYDDTIAEEYDLKLIQYSNDELRKIIGEIDPFEDKPISPKVNIKTSPALDRKGTTPKKSLKSDSPGHSPITSKLDIETSLSADKNETTTNKRFKSDDKDKNNSFEGKSKPITPKLDSPVVDAKTPPKKSIKLDNNDKYVGTVASAVLRTSMSPVVVLHRTQETKRRTRGSLSAKSAAKVAVPLEENVNEIVEETKGVKPKTIENSTNEVINDEEVSANTTPKIPVTSKEDLKEMSKDIDEMEPRKNVVSTDKDKLTMEEEEVMPTISLPEMPVTSKEDLKEIEETKPSEVAASTSKDKLKDEEIIPAETLPEMPVTSKEVLQETLKEIEETKARKNAPSTSKGERFQLGELMWAKIGNFPYWPCVITLEPNSQQFTKVIFKQHKMYHVRFFGDNGRRSWVKEKSLLPFLTMEKLETLQAENRNEVMVPTPNSRHHKNWLIGIEEAKSVQHKTLTEILEYFEQLYEKKKKKRKKQRAERDSPKKKRKQGTTIHDIDEANHTFDSSDTEYTLQLTQKKKKQKNIENDNHRRQSKISRKNKDNSPKKEIFSDREMDETIEILNSMESENRITRSSIPKAADAEKTSHKKKKHLLDESDSDSVISMQDSPPFTMEDQITLYKRNNLFKGVSRERVCQICLKPGVVLKCKGRCCSYYHVECAKKGYTGDDNDSKIIEEVSNTSDDSTSVVGEKVEITNISNKEVVMTTNTHNVEIVHIKDRKRLTPTDLTLDNNPDFNKLALLDQIDQKMKEVMEPVVEKPLYADSTTDYSSADDSFSPVKSLRRKNGIIGVNHQINGEILKKIDEEVDGIITGAIEDKKLKDIVDFKCKNCLDDFDPLCFVCDKKNSKTNSDIRQRCSLSMCGRFYHPECLKMWPQTQWSVSTTTKHNLDTFVCPAHVCHTCVSDDPRMAISRCSSDKVVKCLRCPATYHTSTSCVPAGTEILTSTQIMCPRHGGLKSSRKRGAHSTINTTWCFICSKGGALICCETCPTSVHAECLDINYTDDDKFICEDCETGRFPLYDEIVWVKLGNYRWWPALILFPNEVPENVRNLGHNDGEFVVKFFGTHDHYWISKGRVFVFEEGDTGGGGGHSSRRKVDTIFKKSIQEATVAHQLKKEFKESVIRQSEEKSKNKPPPYIKIKANKPVGNVRQFDGNISNTTPCECDPKEENPCGADSDCLNRLLMTECDPDVCPAGEKCENQCFEKRYYPHLVPYKTEGRGWGLKSLEAITKGQFVIEYVGEMIDEQEYQRRIKKMHEQKEENYYFLTIDKDRMIDAGPKGNVARFMNHCCQPNCETQKWTVNGDTRVGLFAVTDIPPNTELTFNYNLECVGKEKKICRCGAPNCSGFIGVKAKQVQDEKKKHRMKYKKRKRSVTPQIQETKEPCFVCGETGEVNGCNNKICTKFYHSKCVNLDEWSEKWICPWHNCNICSKRTIRCCTKCVNSYCPPHSDGNIRHDRLLGFICSEHDPSKADSHGTPISTKTSENRLLLQTEETDITSTTSDEGSVELELPTINPAHRTTEPSDIITSTPIKSSNTPSNNGEKRKRGRPRKSSIANLQKRIKIDGEDSNNLIDSIDSIKPKNNEDILTSIPNNVEIQKENLTEKDGGCVDEESPRIKLVDDDSTTSNSIKPENINVTTLSPNIVEIQENLTKKERESVEKESPRIKVVDDESTTSNTITPKDIKIPSTQNKVEIQQEKRTKKERRSVEQESLISKLVDDDSTDANSNKPKNNKIPTPTPNKVEVQNENLTRKDRKSFEKESPRLKLVDDSTPTNSVKSKNSKTKTPSKIEIRKENVTKNERKSIEKQSPRLCSLRSSRRLNNSEIIVVSAKEDVVGAMTLRKRRGST